MSYAYLCLEDDRVESYKLTNPIEAAHQERVFYCALQYNQIMVSPRSRNVAFSTEPTGCCSKYKIRVSSILYQTSFMEEVTTVVKSFGNS